MAKKNLWSNLVFKLFLPIKLFDENLFLLCYTLGCKIWSAGKSWEFLCGICVIWLYVHINIFPKTFWLSLARIMIVHKVNIFWLGHKVWKKSPPLFWRYWPTFYLHLIFEISSVTRFFFNFEKSSLKNQKINLISKLIFAGYTGSKNQVRTQQKIKFVPK